MSDLIDRQALLKQIDIDSDGEPGYYGDTWKFIDTIKSMPNVHDLPKDADTISRQAAIDRLAEYGNGRAVFISVGEAIIRIEQLPPAQPEIIACGEGELFVSGADVGGMIDRQAAIEALRAMQTYKLFAGDDMLLIDQAGAQTELMMLPPAQPERIKGRWVDDCTYMGIQCSVCGKSLQDYIHATEYAELMEVPNFCPNCGADMREVTE